MYLLSSLGIISFSKAKHPILELLLEYLEERRGSMIKSSVSAFFNQNSKKSQNYNQEEL